MFERGGLGGKPHRLAAIERLKRGKQVFQQDAPRHAVDHQMMDYEQQALLTRSEIKQCGTQQRPGGEIETRLDPIGVEP